MTHTRRYALVILLVLALPVSLLAQARSHAYAEVGAGATDVNGGGEWLVADSPVGVGGQVGLGWALLGALNVSYHLFARPAANYDVFATVGYMGLSSSEFSSHGVSLGGGGIYWVASRVGLRVDAFGFMPAKTTNNIRVEERSPSRYWGVRAGVAVGFR